MTELARSCERDDRPDRQAGVAATSRTLFRICSMQMQKQNNVEQGEDMEGKGGSKYVFSE